MVEKCVNGRKHRADNEELEREERAQVDQEDKDANFTRTSMLRAPAADHLDEVAEDLIRAKHGAVHPAPSLLHQDHHGLGRVCERLGVGDVSQFEGVHLLDIDLEAHDSIFSEILVSFGTRGYISSILILKKGFERVTLDGLPTEQRVSTWKHLCKAKE